jgi:DNA-binding transcriptional LysR family regulator
VYIIRRGSTVPPKRSHRPAAAEQRPVEREPRPPSWDDLRLFLRCAEIGSFRKAARAAALDSATMIRRITRLEEMLGQKLFLRGAGGLELTSEGRRILEDARTMEQASLNVTRRSRVAERGVRGLVRVAIPEGLGTFWALPRLLDFQRAYRRLTLELRTTNDPLDASRLETDISIQFIRPSQPDLKVAQLGKLHVYPFVSRGYERLYGAPTTREELKSHRLIQLVTAAEGAAADGGNADGIIALRANSCAAVLHAVACDAGVGFLPSYAMAIGADVVPVDVGLQDSLDIWMTYHPDICASQRHALVIEWLRRIFDAQRFPCFGNEFVHPRRLARMMPDAAAVEPCAGVFPVMRPGAAPSPAPPPIDDD